MTLPQVVSRSGESATIEIIQEVEDDWTGVRFTTEPSRYGFGHQQSLVLEVREEGENAKPYESIQFEAEEVSPNGSSLVHSGRATSGENIYTLSTLSLIEANGRAFDPIVLKNTLEIESTSDQ